MEELIWGLLLFALGSLLAVVAILLIVFLIPWSERRGKVGVYETVGGK
jgi:hypothetical protein